MNLLIFPASGRVPARQPAVTGFTGSLPSRDSPAACRHRIRPESLPGPDLIRNQKGKTKQ